MSLDHSQYQIRFYDGKITFICNGLFDDYFNGASSFSKTSEFDLKSYSIGDFEHIFSMIKKNMNEHIVERKYDSDLESNRTTETASFLLLNYLGYSPTNITLFDMNMNLVTYNDENIYKLLSEYIIFVFPTYIETYKWIIGSMFQSTNSKIDRTNKWYETVIDLVHYLSSVENIRFESTYDKYIEYSGDIQRLIHMYEKYEMRLVPKHFALFTEKLKLISLLQRVDVISDGSILKNLFDMEVSPKDMIKIISFKKLEMNPSTAMALAYKNFIMNGYTSETCRLILMNGKTVRCNSNHLSFEFDTLKFKFVSQNKDENENEEKCNCSFDMFWYEIKYLIFY